MDGLCQAGYYCEAGSNGPQQRACPAGTYTSRTGTEAENQCSICPTGFYCPVGSAAPQSCDIGYYCVYASSAPEACPIGELPPCCIATCSCAQNVVEAHLHGAASVRRMRAQGHMEMSVKLARSRIAMRAHQECSAMDWHCKLLVVIVTLASSALWPHFAPTHRWARLAVRAHRVHIVLSDHRDPRSAPPEPSTI
jgi:hypothetical protein